MFIYHFYAGVRASGGIGDELESPYGDSMESWQMLFDLSFFFFVILLAIMQGILNYFPIDVSSLPRFDHRRVRRVA